MIDYDDKYSGSKLPHELRRRLNALKDTRGEASLREFAFWCGDQVADGHHGAGRTIERYRQSLQESGGPTLQDLLNASSGAACAATTIGMRVGPAGASAFLAAFQTGRPNAYEAAVESSWHAREYFRYKELGGIPSLAVNGTGTLREPAHTLDRQIDYLDRLLVRPDRPTPSGLDRSQEGGV